MLQGWVIVAASFAYIGLLFAIAWYGDKRAEAGRSVIANPWIYSLSLAVYATAWTFYGSVGRAASDGVGFLPIYLGPTLMIVLWWFVVRKMIRIAHTNRITSLADFIASRYGKSQTLGGLVTVIAVIGIVPYIALQLKAISTSFAIIRRYPEVAMPAELHRAPLFFGDNTFYIAMLLAAFTILFGTRHLDATERHEGLVAAVAFESPQRLPGTLRSLAAALPERPVAVCRELTKQFEEVARGTAAELAERFPELGRLRLVALHVGLHQLLVVVGQRVSGLYCADSS